MDDVFLFAPSYLLWERGELTEGKAIGTAKHADLALAHNVKRGHKVDPATWAMDLKVGATVGKKKLDEIKATTLRKLNKFIGNRATQKLTDEDFREAMVTVMKTAWRDVYLAGIRAAGTPGFQAGKGKLVIPDLVPGDDVWLKSAMTHEMRFLNGFLDDIINGTGTMPILQRVGMYVDALDSFYNSARVIGLPPDVVLWWVGPHDKSSCAGCNYLFDNNPYTKANLPTVPRSGMTSCLTNCRDRILVRKADAAEVAEVEKGAAFTREQHIRNLRRIKATGKPLGKT